jgi:tRNA nucleotidyltransferase (CCA-adding enzyme)
MNLFDKLSGPRLYEELLLSFQETDPIRTLKRIAEFGLLKVVCPSLTFSDELEATLRSMHETLLWFNLLFLEEKPDTGMLYLMALLSGLKAEDIRTTMDRLSPSPRVKGMILSGIASARDAVGRLPMRDPAEIYKIFHNLKLEVILFVMALSQDRQKKRVVSRYLTELRNIKLALTGRDLKTMGIEPGPVYTNIFGKLLDEKLRGGIKSREDEEEFVKNFLAE